MNFMKLAFAVLSTICFLTVPTVSQASPVGKITDYLVTDYGRFIGDNTNFNGIFRVITTDGTIQAQLTTTKVEDDLSADPPANPFALNVPDVIVAEMTLEPTADGFHQIRNLKIIDKHYGRSLILKNEGLIHLKFGADFGVEIRYQDAETSVGIPYIQIER